jgi:cardiolipin synthase
MRYKIYTNTERAWDAMLESIHQAKNSIFLEMYIFSDNTKESHDFVEVLSAKASLGVSVKIILNSGMNLSDVAVKKLKNSGVEVFFFNKLLRYTHRKALVIDERVAFIGGMNIDKFFSKWHDLQLRVEGKIVSHVMRSFARLYKKVGGHDPLVLKHDKLKLIQKGKVFFFEHFRHTGSFRLSKYYKDKFESAQEKILIVTPYFMPNRWIIKAIKRAAQRGVTVEIVMPKKTTNPKIANLPNYLYMNKLYPYGVRFFLTNEMLHSKIMLVDGKKGILGSQNIDVFSFELNMESGIFFEDQKLIDNLYAVVENWKSDSVMFTPKMRHNYFLDQLVDFTLSAFEYMLKLFNFFTI